MPWREQCEQCGQRKFKLNIRTNGGGGGAGFSKGAPRKPLMAAAAASYASCESYESSDSDSDSESMSTCWIRLPGGGSSCEATTGTYRSQGSGIRSNRNHPMVIAVILGGAFCHFGWSGHFGLTKTEKYRMHIFVAHITCRLEQRLCINKKLKSILLSLRTETLKC
jgi:hypothetical protein